ncbi:Putative cytochrome P450 [Colletotrichum destructivum]|uniref:Cytochrome P450 n=1 Tax=Colletotrichum destructivum TaxID=34406 RepID=A0AAX4IC29_9PEZI|nr:Putative cytochrome P450 [Colletotrichum destructivum]
MLLGFNLGLQPSLMALLPGIVALLIIRRIATMVYRLWFHPLSKFPGPSSLAISNLPFRYHSHIQGLFFKTVAQLHIQYGPIVRISPDSLSIDGQYAWESIYVHKSSGAPEWPKVPGHFFPGDHNVLINAPRETHRRQRRAIAPAFSTVALNDMEPDIVRHVHTLLRALASTGSGECVDIMRWFYLLTMDIVSDLIFSNSFNSLENSTQQKFIMGFFDSTQGLQIGSFLLAFPLLIPLLPLAYMADIGGLKTSRKYGLFIEAKAKARMALGAGRVP